MKKNPSKLVKMRADQLAIHPHAQRDVVPSKLKKLIDGLDLDAIGAVHAVQYPINGVEKVWVIDGQHRLKAILHHGFGEWPVDVIIHTEATDDVRAAQLFLKLNDRATVGPYDKFVNEAKANDPDALGVLKFVQRYGLEVSKSAGDKKLTCIIALKKLYKIDNGKTLNKTLFVATEAWGTKAAALEGKLLEGLGLVIGRHYEALDYDVLIKKLSKYAGSSSGLVGDARGIKEYRHTSLTRCIAERIIETYNQGRRKGKIEPLETVEN
jgi:hypothetical protein